MTLPIEYLEDIYRFINKGVKDAGCELIRIGGIQNHVHMLINLHPSISLSYLMRTIKSKSSGWLKKDDRFPLFFGWAKEYYASTISPTHKDAVIGYIDNQHQHHFNTSFDDEIVKLCLVNAMTYDERDLV